MKLGTSKSILPKKNIIASFAGNGFSSILGLIFTPLYLHFLGIEAYALIGFSLLLQGMLLILDMGLSKTSNREIARLSGASDFETNASLMLRTFEFIYWGIALLIAFSIIGMSSYIASDWLNYEGVTVNEVRLAIIFMGLNLALQWPVSLYSGGIMGLEKHVLLNILLSSLSLLRHIGATLLIWLLSSSIIVFFVWSAIVSLLQVIIFSIVLWRLIRRGHLKPNVKFDISVLKNVWRFSVGVAITQLLAVGIRQVDKIVLSKLLSLEWFGFYMLASLLASAIGTISVPFSNALFPRFTKLLVDKNSTEGLRRTYHRSCQTISIIIFPIVIVVLFYSEDILLLWAQNEDIAHHVAPLLSLLIISTGMNALISLPYALQLAHGWTSLAMYQNFISLCIQIPLVFYFIETMGVNGAAIPRIIHNFSYMFILIPIMHLYILKGEVATWYIKDTLFPLLIVLFVCSMIYIVSTMFSNIPVVIAMIFSLVGSYSILYKYSGLKVVSFRGSQ